MPIARHNPLHPQGGEGGVRGACRMGSLSAIPRVPLTQPSPP
jgi:hypothetical protein